MSTKQKYNFVQQTAGDTFLETEFGLELNDSPIDISAYAIKAEFRKDNNNGEVVHTATVGNGITVINALQGEFKIDECLMPEEAGIYPYDIEFTLPGGQIRTYLFGVLDLTEDITA